LDFVYLRIPQFNIVKMLVFCQLLPLRFERSDIVQGFITESVQIKLSLVNTVISINCKLGFNNRGNLINLIFKVGDDSKPN
jgi:hypothetical protein